MTEIAVAAHNVSKRFRLYHERNQSLKAAVMRGRRALVEEFWALRDVTLEVASGTTFGLIGENGSGKSTLLKCMARILRPDGGGISVNGKISALLELGAGFHPELSGRENVFLNGAILGLSQRELEQKFDEIVDFASLGQFIDQPVKNYSSGMYVRLGFSVAINVDPDILLVDEVLSVGDEAFQRKCNEKFAQLREAGKTIIIVSHGLAAVNNLCDQVAWLEHGVLKEVGPANDVIQNYVGHVQLDHQVDEEGHTRWGSGEVQVTRVELLSASGAPVGRVQTGERLTIRLHYSCSEAVESPVFDVKIHTVEGVQLAGPSTRETGPIPAKLTGTGYVDYVLDRLLLLQGTYDISVSVHDRAILHAYDIRQRVRRFDVDPGVPAEQGGLVSLDGSWHLTEEPSP